MKLRKKIVTNIRFFFRSVWIFNYTRGHSLGIGASTKILFGLEKPWNAYQTT